MGKVISGVEVQKRCDRKKKEKESGSLCAPYQGLLTILKIMSERKKAKRFVKQRGRDFCTFTAFFRVNHKWHWWK